MNAIGLFLIPLKVLEIVLLSALVFGVVYTAASTSILGYELFIKSRRRRLSAVLPSISILKPLKGLDDQLEQNLRSFFTLDYPKYELIFGVNEADDPAIAVVTRLQKEFPEVDSQVIIDRRNRSLNPKINNLRNMLPSARFEYLLISDSNIRVGADYLRDMMAHMQRKNVGLVTSTIRGVCAGTIAGLLENLHLNSFVASSVFAVRHMFKVPVVIGKSMLFTRETLKRLGGFEFFGNFLAEDQLIGLGVRALGYKIRTSTHFVDNVNESWNWKKFLNRHVRWGKMRRNLDLPNYLAEILSHPLPLALAYAAVRADFHGLFVLMMALMLKYTADITAIAMMKSDIKVWQLPFLPLKDAIMFCIWFVPFFSRHINWRGNLYRIEKRTHLAEPAPVID